MPPIIPISRQFDQSTLGKLLDADTVVQRYRTLFALLDRDSILYKVVYTQRTACERINSQAKHLGIERPKARNIRSVRRLNTLIYIMINAKALQRARAINASLLMPQLGKIA